MRRYVLWVLAHRKWVAVAVLTLTGLALVSLSRARFGTSLAELIFGDDPAFLASRDRAQRFGTDARVVMAVPWPAGIDTEFWPALRGAADNLETHEEVRAVESVLSLHRLLEAMEAAGGRAAPALERAALVAHPLIGGLWVATDGGWVLLVVDLTAEQERPIEQTPALVGELVDLVVEAGFDRDRIHLAGVPAVMAEIHRQTRSQIVRLTPVVVLVVLGLIWLLIRQITPVLITLIVGGLAVIWTMGFAIALDPQVNLVLAMCPALIFIIAFSDVVHLVGAIQVSINQGGDPRDAVIEGSSEVGVACGWTSLTTLVGFAGLSLIDVPAFRQAGLILGTGVALALWLAITLVPIALAWRPPAARTTPSHADMLLDGWLQRVDGLVKRRRTLVIAVFGLITAMAVWGTTRISVETDLVARMPETSPLRRSTKLFNEVFSGANAIELYAVVPPASIFDPAFHARLRQAQLDLTADPNVGCVLSVGGLLDEMQGTNPVGLSGMLGDRRLRRSLRRLVDLSRGELRFSILLRQTGMKESFVIAERLRAILASSLGEGVVVEAGGLMYLSGRWLDRHVSSQRKAIVVSFAAIAFLMVLLARSVRAGLLAMVPNLIPLLFLGGVLGWGWRQTDSDVAIVALIAIGIAVDDTVHWLTRYRHEASRGTGRLGRTTRSAGRAMTITTIVLAAGFIPFSISGYLSIQLIGLLLPWVMIVALLSDLLLLPALFSTGIAGPAWADNATDAVTAGNETVD